jgi:hypothetical protein
MKTVITVSAALLLISFASGCSKTSGEQPKTTISGTRSSTDYGVRMKMIDWGAVDVSAQPPKRFSLGAGKSCSLTGSTFQEGIWVVAETVVTNPDGSVGRSRFGFLCPVAGERCVVPVPSAFCSDYNTVFMFTPILKKRGDNAPSGI